MARAPEFVEPLGAAGFFGRVDRLCDLSRMSHCTLALERETQNITNHPIGCLERRSLELLALPRAVPTSDAVPDGLDHRKRPRVL